MYVPYILQSDDPNSSTAAIMEEARKLVLKPRSHFKLHFNFLSLLIRNYTRIFRHTN